VLPLPDWLELPLPDWLIPLMLLPDCPIPLILLLPDSLWLFTRR